jgi:hypothetical protein
LAKRIAEPLRVALPPNADEESAGIVVPKRAAPAKDFANAVAVHDAAAAKNSDNHIT